MPWFASHGAFPNILDVLELAIEMCFFKYHTQIILVESHGWVVKIEFMYFCVCIYIYTHIHIICHVYIKFSSEDDWNSEGMFEEPGS